MTDKQKKTKTVEKHQSKKSILFLKEILDFRKFKNGKRAQFILNIATGLAIVLLMHGLENTGWGEGILNTAFDRFIKSEAKETVKSNEDPGDLLFIDIGHHKKNEIPKKKTNTSTDFLSPRDTIARLLEKAFAGKARVIVLDFAFEEKDCCHPERDEKLRTVLTGNQTKKAKVIFPVKILRDNTIKGLIFDDLIDENPNYMRAISTVLASQNDAVVRYWKTFKQYEDYRVLWSIPVLAAALHRGKEKELENLEFLMIQRNKKIAAHRLDIGTGEKKRKLLLPVKDFDLYAQRIRFRLIPGDCLPGNPEGNIRVPAIENLKPRHFRDKIVIVGNSDLELGDILDTPAGPMPGMYIHANAIHTLLKGYQPKRAPWWVSFLIDLFIILCAAYMFHHIDIFWKDLLVLIVGFFGLGAFGYFCFFKSFGIFPNYVFGIVAIGYVEIMGSLKDILEKFRKKKGEKEIRASEDKK